MILIEKLNTNMNLININKYKYKINNIIKHWYYKALGKDNLIYYYNYKNKETKMYLIVYS